MKSDKETVEIMNALIDLEQALQSVGFNETLTYSNITEHVIVKEYISQEIIQTISVVADSPKAALCDVMRELSASLLKSL